ncbi:optic atrophy 3 protein-domain-containing protein [Mycena maculata]|uniref:Optic atrophy 3 protein-domain-containing protein n=1 Tax=Mycena maculata TaxID=230809 RepID=A0AAD7IV42_9AGAR|nr:optic atrophy 3 protein-domain-containing protein [Mycena maculata]
MASAKIATLLIRTVAKPISAQIKNQAKQHERFRGFCVNLAQMMYRSEVKLRTNILGEPAKHIRPLSETRAIENGANALAEGFLFTVAAGLILGEAWRSSRSQSKRRDIIDEQIEDLKTNMQDLTAQVTTLATNMESHRREIEQRNDELTRIMQRIVQFGLSGGWAEFEGTPLQLPRIDPVSPQRDARIDSDDPKPSSS